VSGHRYPDEESRPPWGIYDGPRPPVPARRADGRSSTPFPSAPFPVAMRPFQSSELVLARTAVEPQRPRHRRAGTTPATTAARSPRVYAAMFGAVLAAGAILRLWTLATRPDWQYDEGVYLNVVSNLLTNGTVNEHITYGAPFTPDVYEPPYYFLVLSRWFALTGASIYHARILGVLFSLVTLTLLWRLLIRLHGQRIAFFAIVPIVFDGWLLFVQRVSYLENMMLMMVTAGMLLYRQALERPDRWRFAVAGLMLGAAVAVKYSGVSVLLTVALCYLILRRERAGHLTLLGWALGTLFVSIVIQFFWFDSGGHYWWLDDTWVQIRRVAGLQASGGTLTSPIAALHLLFTEYDVFAPSFLIALAAFVLVLLRLWTCWRERSWRRVRANALLWSWMLAGLVVLGVSSLKYPQYFALILVPMYAWFWTEASQWRWPWSWDRLRALAAVAVVAGLLSFYGRVAAHADNPFADVQQYAATAIPANAVVVADEAVGDLIKQPYCREQNTAPCAGVASYAITWDTYLQSTWQLGDAGYHQMMAGATQLRSWTGFNGTVTVWRLKK
jgi:4-amino-4-deoxy-L-arabinose transferase-like glycosyltransferase